MSSGHRAVIEAGPVTIRRRCCGGAESNYAAAALEWIDDPVGLVDGQPVAVPELLRDALACPVPVESVEVIHPSWWPVRRVQLLLAAARSVADEAVTRSRATVLSAASDAAVVVEIAGGLVAVTGTSEVVAEPRVGAPGAVADAVARRVLAAVGHHPGAVLIDAPPGVGGAAVLAEMIRRRLRPEISVVVCTRLPASVIDESVDEPVDAPAKAVRPWRHAPACAAAGLAFAVVLAWWSGHEPTSANVVREHYLVAGRVAVQVPESWLVRRVVGVTGSPRVEVVSPADPQIALYITQAPAPFADLAAVAESLQRGLRRAEVQTPGVFLGFDAAGSSAGRAAVTYREVRDDRQIDWAVLVDGAVRIGIGCQSGSGGADVLRSVCEQAVRSARALE